MHHPYSEGAGRLADLEDRTTAYRWDIETAPPWNRAKEQGKHAPPALLRGVAVDLDRLGDHLATFDWFFAMTVCRTFSILEEQVIEFAREVEGSLPSKSITALVEEEYKHVELFNRYRAVLLEQGDRELFERVYAPTEARLRERFRQPMPDAVHQHYLFWTSVIFFEEFSIYFEELVRDMPDAQPLWRALHRLHRIEEIQHLATDEGYLEALAIDPAKKRAFSQKYVMSLLSSFHDTVGVSAALQWAKQIGLGDLCPVGLVSKRPFIRDVITHPSFKRTRAAAPYLAELA